MDYLKGRTVAFLHWSEKYTKTDMVYLAKGGFWLNLSTLYVSLCSLVLYIVFANVLSKETYGTYQYLLSLSAIIGAFTLTGMNPAVSRAVTRGNEGVFLESIRIQMRWAIIPFLLSLALATYYLVHGNTLFFSGLVLISFLTPFSYVLNTYTAFLQGKQEFYRVFLYSFIQNSFFYGGLLLCVFFFDLPLLLLATNLILTVLPLYAIHRHVIHHYRPNKQTDEESIPYGKKLSSMNVISYALTQADNILAFHFLGPTSLAIYNFATAIPDRVAGLFRFIPAVALPRFAAAPDTDRGRKWFLYRLLWGLAAGAAITLVYILTAPIIFRILFPQYGQSVSFSQWYALTIIASVGSIFSSLFVAQLRTKNLYVLNVLLPFFTLSMQVVGILVWGLGGLIAAKVTASFLVLFLGLALL